MLKEFNSLDSKGQTCGGEVMVAKPVHSRDQTSAKNSRFPGFRSDRERDFSGSKGGCIDFSAALEVTNVLD